MTSSEWRRNGEYTDEFGDVLATWVNGDDGFNVPTAVEAAIAVPYVEALREALDQFEDALPYVPDSFREKWGYDETVSRLRALVVERPEDGEEAGGE